MVSTGPVPATAGAPVHAAAVAVGVEPAAAGSAGEEAGAPRHGGAVGLPREDPAAAAAALVLAAPVPAAVPAAVVREASAARPVVGAVGGHERAVHGGRNREAGAETGLVNRTSPSEDRLDASEGLRLLGALELVGRDAGTTLTNVPAHRSRMRGHELAHGANPSLRLDREAGPGVADHVVGTNLPAAVPLAVHQVSI